MHLRKIKEKAFTLIELAIVIVIIGLITGGVLGTNSLIESSKINSIITQNREFEQTLGAFKLEYNYLPGDMPQSEAQAYGFSNNGASNDDSNISFGVESALFFTQMYEAEIFPYYHAYNSARGIGIEKPYPEIRNVKGGITAASRNNQLYYWYILGVYEPATADLNNHTQGIEPFTPIRAYKIDKKLDDGKPEYGKVKAALSNGNSLTLATANSTTTVVNNSAHCLTNVVNNTYQAYNLNSSTANDQTRRCGLAIESKF